MRFGRCQVINVTPVIDTVAYTSGDSVGGKITAGAIANAFGQGVLKDLVVVDKANQKQPLTFLFFDQDPSAGTYTNNGAVTLDPADALKVIAKVNVAAADYETVGGKAVAAVEVSKVVKGTPDSNRTLYLLVVTTGTPTYAVGDLLFRLGLLVD